MVYPLRGSGGYIYIGDTLVGQITEWILSAESMVVDDTKVTDQWKRYQKAIGRWSLSCDFFIDLNDPGQSEFLDNIVGSEDGYIENLKARLSWSAAGYIQFFVANGTMVNFNILNYGSGDVVKVRVRVARGVVLLNRIFVSQVFLQAEFRNGDPSLVSQMMALIEFVNESRAYASQMLLQVEYTNS